MKLATCNIWDQPATRMHEDCLEIKRNLGRPVVVWQEVEQQREHRAIEDVFAHRYNHLFDTKALPLSVPEPWEVVETKVVMTHRGLAQTTPNRFILSAVIRNTHRPKLDPIVIMGTHFVSGAWWNPGQPHEAERVVFWNEHWQDMKFELQHWKSQDLTVLFAGDFNKKHVGKFHPKMRWLIDGGIDKIGVLEGSVKVSCLEVGRIKLNSDHDARWVDVRLSVK